LCGNSANAGFTARPRLRSAPLPAPSLGGSNADKTSFAATAQISANVSDPVPAISGNTILVAVLDQTAFTTLFTLACKASILLWSSGDALLSGIVAKMRVPELSDSIFMVPSN
jgi:hypothetical protein